MSDFIEKPQLKPQFFRSCSVGIDCLRDYCCVYCVFLDPATLESEHCFQAFGISVRYFEEIVVFLRNAERQFSAKIEIIVFDAHAMDRQDLLSVLERSEPCWPIFRIDADGRAGLNRVIGWAGTKMRDVSDARWLAMVGLLQDGLGEQNG